jgi:hypothetical protein
LFRIHTYGGTESVPAVMSSGAALAAIAASIILLCERRIKKPKRWWTRQLFAGYTLGLDLLDILKLEDGYGFRNFTQMTPTDFECLLQVIGGKITRVHETQTINSSINRIGCHSTLSC